MTAVDRTSARELQSTHSSLTAERKKVSELERSLSYQSSLLGAETKAKEDAASRAKDFFERTLDLEKQLALANRRVEALESQSQRPIEEELKLIKERQMRRDVARARQADDLLAYVRDSKIGWDTSGIEDVLRAAESVRKHLKRLQVDAKAGRTRARPAQAQRLPGSPRRAPIPPIGSSPRKSPAPPDAARAPTDDMAHVRETVRHMDMDVKTLVDATTTLSNDLEGEKQRRKRAALTGEEVVKHAEEDAARIITLQAEVTDLEERIQDLHEKNKMLNTKRVALSGELKVLTTAHDMLQRDLERTCNELQHAENECLAAVEQRDIIAESIVNVCLHWQHSFPSDMFNDDLTTADKTDEAITTMVSGLCQHLEDAFQQCKDRDDKLRAANKRVEDDKMKMHFQINQIMAEKRGLVAVAAADRERMTTLAEKIANIVGARQTFGTLESTGEVMEAAALLTDAVEISVVELREEISKLEGEVASGNILRSVQEEEHRSAVIEMDKSEAARVEHQEEMQALRAACKKLRAGMAKADKQKLAALEEARQARTTAKQLEKEVAAQQEEDARRASASKKAIKSLKDRVERVESERARLQEERGVLSAQVEQLSRGRAAAIEKAKKGAAALEQARADHQAAINSLEEKHQEEVDKIARILVDHQQAAAEMGALRLQQEEEEEERLRAGVARAAAGATQREEDLQARCAQAEASRHQAEVQLAEFVQEARGEFQRLHVVIQQRDATISELMGSSR